MQKKVIYDYLEEILKYALYLLILYLLIINIILLIINIISINIIL